MKKNVIFFEVEGGSNKESDGYRKDTMPMINALKEKGWHAEVIFYADHKRNELLEYVKDNADAVVSRINPGDLPNGETHYFNFLIELNHLGIILMPHPKDMVNYGTKDVLCKLTDTELVPNDTYVYYTLAQLQENFPISLSLGERVLKQNRGSDGNGIWRVVVTDKRKFVKGQPLPLDTQIKCTEAIDHHVEHHELAAFMDYLGNRYLGENGSVVDMRFFPRIKEGEIRIFYVGEQPIFVIHKQPPEMEEAFCAAVSSGATYRYDNPNDWKKLIEHFSAHIPIIQKKLGSYNTPLIWTADFILDWDKNGTDKYILSEINCSCVGFASHLHLNIQQTVADKIISVITKTGEKQK